MAVFGIDLGTTNSCIALFKDGKPEVVPVDNPSGIVPSVVSLENGEFIVGTRARNRAAAFPESTVSSVKRHMGETEQLKIREGKLIRMMSPEEISSLILKYLASEAARLTGLEVKDVVITVPAYFSDAQRHSTMDAGHLAGLNVLRLINEPTAASLFYNQITPPEAEEYQLVYDLGGGTFDVSILRSGDISEVLASTGDTHLGGDDFDLLVIDRLLESTDLKADAIHAHAPAMARLRLIAEAARIALSSAEYTQVRETGIPNPKGGTFSLDVELTRLELEELCEPLIEKTLESVRKAVDEASVEISNISKVLLVGGVTRMPAIPSSLGKIFDAVNPAIDPDRAVANGASIQGGILTGEQCDRILIDVTPHTLSVASATHMDVNGIKEEFGAADDDLGEMLDPWHRLICTPIISRNTQIPVTHARTFGTMQDNQKLALIKVYQGEFITPDKNTLLGEVELKLAKAPEGCPIVIEYSYDKDGIVRMRAEQKGYGKKVEIHLDSRNPNPVRVDTSEVEPEIVDAEDMDIPEHESSAPVNFVTRRTHQVLDKMPEGADKEKITAMLAEYEEALMNDEDDIDEMEDALMDELEKMEKDAD